MTEEQSGKKNEHRVLLKRGRYVKDKRKVARLARPKRYLIEDISKDFHTDAGYVKSDDLEREGEVIYSNVGAEFVSFSPSFIDYYNKLLRRPQVIPEKDIGIIITSTGLGKDSAVVDAGAGSGALAIMLARVAGHVTTYEVREDHYKVVEKNIRRLGMENITLKHKDIYEGLDETELDLVTLDLPEPWKAIEHVRDALRVGGFCVIYNPSIIQISDTMETVSQYDCFQVIKNIEVTEREWEVQGRKVRPFTGGGIGHSGFMSFIRKISR